ncbi:IgGFc-binding protein-like [Anolis sagrei]|uniref:IgGFc-binding protein-like n=1 Tax=Anolis sagrei TaxID=38937 RepID=UPI00351FBF4A
MGQRRTPRFTAHFCLSDYLARCDFNNNSWPFCDWTQVCYPNQGSWIRTKHATPTPGTGPDGDHPDGSGFYIYQEATNHLPFDVNRLESPTLAVLGDICIDFWFHMFGSEDANELKVVVVAEEGREDTAWSRKGSQGSTWIHGLASVNFSKEENIKVVFDAIRGLTEYGDTAIDNVAVWRGPCEKTACSERRNYDRVDKLYICGRHLASHFSITAAVPSPLPLRPDHRWGQGRARASRFSIAAAVPSPPPVRPDHCWATESVAAAEATILAPRLHHRCRCCDQSTAGAVGPSQGTVNAAAVAAAILAPRLTIAAFPSLPLQLLDSSTSCDFSCSFEVDFCSWMQSDTDSFDWTRHKGPTSSSTTGPSFDHTTGEGYFIYLQSNEANPGDVAHLVSPTCTSDGPRCFSFWYHMYGVARTMALYVYVVLDGGAPEMVWSETGNQGNRWKKAEISITHTGRLQMILEGMRGEDFRSDVAVDDIYVTDGYCPGHLIPTTPVTTTTPVFVPPTFESCVVSGNLHYYTFDQQAHHFMGNCTYTLSQPCGPHSLLLPTFNVEATNEHRGGNTQVSYVKSVDVDVQGIRITLEKGGTVKVNGKEGGAPSDLEPFVQIFPSGFYTVVTTIFGLMVRFDGDHHVEVTLSSIYRGKVCGLCGNYNSNPDDDFLNPRGELEPDSTSLGNSWLVGDLTDCSSGSSPVCTEDEIEEAQSSRFCGFLLDVTGPFRHCHSILDPSVYFDGCVYDQCALPQDLGSLCRSLQSYADACQSRGVHIDPWRNATFCPVSCPPNSHYESCASACPGTCVDPMSPATCSLPCTESCACDSGFLLHGNGACVPSQQCGCWEQGKQYPVGSEFWTDDTCSSKCVCPQRGGRLECHSTHCPADHFCGVQNGVPGCYPHTFGFCYVYGDPHYFTLDKAMHHFMGNCTYTLAKVCANSAGLPFFNVEAKNEFRWGNPSVTFVQRVMVDVYGERVEIVKKERSHVLVNKVRMTLPVYWPDGSFHVERSGRYVRLETVSGLSVSYDTDHTVQIKLPTDYSKQTCGMCGNFNGRRQDDQMMPNGQQASSSTELGNSWQVPNAEYDESSCGAPTEDHPPCPPESEALYASEAFCGLLTSVQGPWAACLSVVSPGTFFESCVFDLCALGGGQLHLCGVLQVYADACQQAGVIISTWRNATFCPLPCPPNSRYNLCTSSCPATCSDPEYPRNCNRPCVEGCECEEGFLLSGGNCVASSDCGCFVEGRYFEKGEAFWQPDCAGHCICGENGSLVCSPESCLEGQLCKVQDGALGCHVPEKATCHIYGYPHYITFDGKLYHFWGGCNYTAVKLCSNASEPFSITIRNENQSSSTWTALNSVAISFQNLHVVLRKNKEVYVNGAKVGLPADLPLGLHVEESPPHVVLRSPLGFLAKFDGDQELLIQVDERYKGQLCGLCGTFSGSQLDDFLKPDGSLEDDPNVFGNSWRVPDDDWTCDSSPVVPPPCDPIKEEDFQDLCKVLLAKDGPFALGHGSVPPQLYFETCVYDQCATGGDSGQFCKSLEAYAAACEQAEVALGEWRKGTTCDSSTSCDFSCSFEVDFCSWMQSDTDSFDWTRHKGPTSSSTTGPSFDHTSGEGYFIYLKSNEANPGDVAHLVSPTCASDGPCCFSFWYHMYGVAHTMALYVYVVPDGGSPEMVWSERGNQGNRWKKAEVSITHTGRPQIILEGMLGEDFRSDVAVDDIYVTDGYCPGEVTTTTASTTMSTGPPTFAVSCPPNSHYESCASACPGTCVDPMSPATCSLPCTESCACDSGFLLHGNGACVPSHQCGCWEQGKHYPVGSEFWTDDTCSSKCVCHQRGGRLDCLSARCPADHFCGVQNGVPGCYPHTFGVCYVYGDPHYYTLDKAMHHFMGNCTYTLAKVCATSTVLPFFNVEAKNEFRWGNPSVTFVQRVMVDVYNQRVEIFKKEQRHVLARRAERELRHGTSVEAAWVSELLPHLRRIEGEGVLNLRKPVNKVRMTLPVHWPDGSFQVETSGRYVRLETNFSLLISFDTDHTVEIRLPTSYSKQTCGMCGNFNGRRQDDQMMPNGQQASSSTELGNSWQVPNAEYDESSCGAPTEELPPCSPEAEALYASEAFCGLLTSVQGPWAACLSVVSPGKFFESCVFDLCALGGSQQILCGALQAYADACQRAGVNIATWRTATFCPLDCPPNTHYEPCSPGCPATCLNPQAPNNCTQPCAEGCACNAGLVLSGGDCVPESKCGCTYAGQYYADGESFVSEDCTDRCVCQGNGSILCVPMSCSPEEACKVQGGLRGCYPASSATCHVYGDLHYSTFDGRLHHFQGPCNYTLVQSCNKDTGSPFSITARNEHRGSPHWTTLNSVALTLEGFHIALQKGKAIYINGVLAKPTTLHLPDVIIDYSESHVGVTTNIGVHIQFDGDQDLLIDVTETHRGKVCGLCGTYTGDPQDDFSTPNGTIVEDLAAFGNSWRVPDDQWPCDSTIPDPVPCPPSEQQAAVAQCQVLRTVDGPFSACHPVVSPWSYFVSCTHDLCATGGSDAQLCHLLRSYAAACQTAGVTLGDWEAGTVCGPPPSAEDTTTASPVLSDATPLQSPEKTPTSPPPLTEDATTFSSILSDATPLQSPEKTPASPPPLTEDPTTFSSILSDATPLQSPEKTSASPPPLTEDATTFSSILSDATPLQSPEKTPASPPPLTEDASTFSSILSDATPLQSPEKTPASPPPLTEDATTFSSILSDATPLQSPEKTPASPPPLTEDATTFSSILSDATPLQSPEKTPASPPPLTEDATTFSSILSDATPLQSPEKTPASPPPLTEDATTFSSILSDATPLQSPEKTPASPPPLTEDARTFSSILSDATPLQSPEKTPASPPPLTEDATTFSSILSDATPLQSPEKTPASPPPLTEDATTFSSILSDATPLQSPEKTPASPPPLTEDATTFSSILSDATPLQSPEKTPTSPPPLTEDATTFSSILSDATPLQSPEKTPASPPPLTEDATTFSSILSDATPLQSPEKTPASPPPLTEDATTFSSILSDATPLQSPEKTPATPPPQIEGPPTFSPILPDATPSQPPEKTPTSPPPLTEDARTFSSILSDATPLQSPEKTPASPPPLTEDATTFSSILSDATPLQSPEKTPASPPPLTEDATTFSSILSDATPLQSPEKTPASPSPLTEDATSTFSSILSDATPLQSPEKTPTSPPPLTEDATSTFSSILSDATPLQSPEKTPTSPSPLTEDATSTFSSILSDATPLQSPEKTPTSPPPLTEDATTFSSILSDATPLQSPEKTPASPPPLTEDATTFSSILSDATPLQSPEKTPATPPPQIEGPPTFTPILPDATPSHPPEKTPTSPPPLTEDATTFSSILSDATPLQSPEKTPASPPPLSEDATTFSSILSDATPLQSPEKTPTSPPPLTEDATTFSSILSDATPLQSPEKTPASPPPLTEDATTFSSILSDATPLQSPEKTPKSPPPLTEDATTFSSILSDATPLQSPEKTPASPPPLTEDARTFSSILSDASPLQSPEKTPATPPPQIEGPPTFSPILPDATPSQPPEKTPTSRATCIASGDPHYNTFDNRVYHFMGNCTYTLSQVCADASDVPSVFHVSTTNENRGSNMNISYVKAVHVEIQGVQVSLLKNKNVNVNDQRRNLPIFIDNNTIVVQRSGSYVSLETKFGLGVRFDGNHFAEVSVPPAYKERLCGMCGNYNGDPRDDNLKPDGQPASSSNSLGDSWLVPDNLTECSSPDPRCKQDLEEEIRRESACTMITDPAGIFKDCHPMVNPNNFFENCVMDTCLTGGQQTAICNGVQAYAESCSNAGLCLEWRNATFCPISCPSGSHYQSCGERCAASCVTPSLRTACSPLPIGGCFCDEGFLLSGDQCVPESSCGCINDQGQYFQLGESWFPEETCSERCTCEHGDSIVCTPWECGVLEKCSVQDGVLGCHTSNRASCHVAGDPHVYTFDKVMHTFLGSCTYTLATLCSNNSTATPFTVSGRNEDRGQWGATYLREVYVDFHGTRVTLQKNKRILFDQERAYAPAERRTSGKSISVGNVGNYLVLETNSGLMVKYDGDQHLEISLPGTYFSQVCGLCGNYNDFQGDELLMPDGTQAQNVTEFGNSWKVDSDSDASCLPDDRQDLGPPCSAELHPFVEEQCHVLQSGPFVPCHRLVQPELFIQTCIFDMCKYDGMLSTLCAITQAYADACKTEGVALKWRNSTFCPLPCPPNSHYTDCASPCPATCTDIYAKDLCEKPAGQCLEGCTCDEECVLSDDQCVPLSECGCRDKDDNYYKVGESWVTRHCTQKCRCRSGGFIKCQSFGCDVGEICQLKKNGKYGCKTTGFGKCLVTGDSHYFSFDGLQHHFQGKHTYVVTQTRPDAPAHLEPFSIEGENTAEGVNGKITFLKELKISVYNHTVLLGQQRKLVVDGVKTVPPAQPHEGLRIQQRATRMFMDTDFGFSVAFDGTENADIILPNAYKRNVEGLCGNFDGKHKNDFTTPDGTLVSNVDSFGESWKVPVQRGTARFRREALSEEDLDGIMLDTGFFLLCSPEQLSQVSSSTNCGVLADPSGPFQACFNRVSPSNFLTACLFDLCVENNRTARLCPILEQYALACQEEGVSLPDWREKVACALQCPPNSKYSACMSACPASCSDLAAPAECDTPCLEGCECLPGYVLSGFECVPFRECGCSFLGRYYQAAETFMTEDCGQTCLCTNSSRVSCSRTACAHGELCTVVNFVRGCYTDGPCLSSPCLNGGVCAEDSSPKGFHCRCSQAYHGNYCEIETNVIEKQTEDYSRMALYITLGVSCGAVLLTLITAIALCSCLPRKRTRNSREAQSPHPSRASSSAARRDFIHVSNVAFEQD